MRRLPAGRSGRAGGVLASTAGGCSWAARRARVLAAPHPPTLHGAASSRPPSPQPTRPRPSADTHTHQTRDARPGLTQPSLWARAAALCERLIREAGVELGTDELASHLYTALGEMVHPDIRAATRHCDKQ